jgi:galactose-1-phosphate uridylyltransferase
MVRSIWLARRRKTKATEAADDEQRVLLTRMHMTTCNMCIGGSDRPQKLSPELWSVVKLNRGFT